MKQAPDIRFIGMAPSEALASAARDPAAPLELMREWVSRHEAPPGATGLGENGGTP